MKYLLYTLWIICTSSLMMAQTTTENYITNTSYQVKTTTGSVPDSDKIESVIYFDGLGRPKQSVAIRAGGNSEDIIAHIGYDDYGRQDKDYLPYAINTDGGLFRTDALNATIGFYNNSTKYENTANPFSEKTFEASPLNRVLNQAAPGFDWRKGGGHEIEFNYQTNISNEVKKYNVNLSFANNTYTPALILDGSYSAGELYKTITYNENHSAGLDHSIEEFKDKQGRILLKRTYNANIAHDTHYVYDDYGNLIYVLPPKAIDLINPNNLQGSIVSNSTITSGNSLSLAATSSIVLSEGFHAQSGSTFTANIESYLTTLDELCYQYKYDHRNRLVEKKIPGKGWEYIVYNKLNQPILTQDANLQANGEWLFTKYDAFGRVAYTGLFSSASPRITLQTAADATSAQYVTQNTSSISLGGANVYYSGDNTVYPTSGISGIYTINYYDKYVDVGSGVSEVSYTKTPITNVKDLSTVSKVRVLDSNPVKWITTVTYYDEKSRPIYVYNHNDYLETTDKMKRKYDFVKVLEITTIHEKTNQSTIITTIDTFTYDHAGRLKSQKQKINTQPEELIVLNQYDELGQLENKKVGGAVASTIENSTGLQIVDYTYNIRGWLKGINNTAGSNLSITLGSTDLFGFQINYNSPASGTPLFNGNISETLWKTTSVNNTSNPVSNKYTYSYDALNRITGAVDNTTNYNLDLIDYDKNGNIMHLKRQGHTDTNVTNFGLMDDLAYAYQGNQLTVVDDATLASAVTGFIDGAESSLEYVYDTNGNMISDANKGITSIAYNHLNLPKTVNINDGGSNNGTISYIYDATGIKLSKTISSGNITYYAGNYVYEGSSLKFFNHPEGYIEPVDPGNYGSGFKYVYQYKDHLGNIRLSYTDSNNNGSVTSSEILEENNYYPFGLKHEGYNNAPVTNHPYKYQGVEFNESLGFNFYEMDVRSYDPAIARFTSIDPVTHHSFSTYNAFDNNPVYWSDPSGADSDDDIRRNKENKPEWDHTLSSSADGNGDCCNGAGDNGQPMTDGITLDEVVVTASKSGSKNDGGGYWSSEGERYGYSGSFGQYKNQFGYSGNYSEVSAAHEAEYGAAFRGQVAQWDAEQRADRLMGKLWFFTGVFSSIGQVYVYGGSVPGTLAVSASARAFGFKGLYAPPSNPVYGYYGVGADGVGYVGISSNPAIRFSAHGRAIDGKQFLQYDIKAQFNSRLDARIWEQQNINNFGLKNLLNRRNEIRPTLWMQNGIKP